ncbi:MAG: hypothetical protein D6725_09195 [Planctomycetota bacterium]|nr:MAG: hypothetical protein D6725_09195 [Planctomycetota bacterium]
MSRSFDEELLSAYLDGELAAAERAAVERWLSQSPEARETLEHFRAVSAAVREIRIRPLSDHFPSRLMQMLEREAVVEVATAAAEGGGGSRLASRASARRSARAWIAAATCAAAVGVCVLWWPGVGPRLVGRHRAKAPALGGASAPRAGALADKVAGSQEESGAGGAAEVAAQPLGGFGEAGAAVAAGVVGEPVPGAPGEEQLQFYVVRRDDDGRQLWLRRSPEQLRIGDVVEAMAADDENVAVVQLNVVDRVEGLQRLQLLLAENAIPPTAQARVAVAENGGSGADRRAPENPAADRVAAGRFSETGLFGVYVETDSSSLQMALQRLLEEPEFREITIGPQVQWAALGDDVRRQVAVVRSQVVESVASQSPAAVRSAARIPSAVVESAGGTAAVNAGDRRSRSTAPRVAALNAAAAATPAPGGRANVQRKEAKGRPQRAARRVAAANAAVAGDRASRGEPSRTAAAKSAVAEAQNPPRTAAAAGERSRSPERGAPREARRTGADESAVAAAGGVADRPSVGGAAPGAVAGPAAQPALAVKRWSYQIPVRLPESVLEKTRRIIEQDARGPGAAAPSDAAAESAGTQRQQGVVAATAREKGGPRRGDTPKASKDVRNPAPSRTLAAGGAMSRRAVRSGAADRPATLPKPKRVLFLVIQQSADGEAGDGAGGASGKTAPGGKTQRGE